MVNKDFLALLKKTRANALATYSNFKVGTILVTSEGEKYTGYNIESSSYGLTICAERVALFKALSEGERKFKELYIIGSNDEFCAPCGACRQVIMDYAPDINIVLVNDKGESKIFKITELLPEAFTDKRLRKRRK
jgi:cytidine deaminase